LDGQRRKQTRERRGQNEKTFDERVGRVLTNTEETSWT
jgi:hypothetical protein